MAGHCYCESFLKHLDTNQHNNRPKPKGVPGSSSCLAAVYSAASTMSASDGAATVVRCLEKAVIELGKPPKDTNFFTAQFSRQDPAVKELKDQCAAAVTVCGTGPRHAH